MDFVRIFEYQDKNINVVERWEILVDLLPSITKSLSLPSFLGDHDFAPKSTLVVTSLKKKNTKILYNFLKSSP